jgi:hypothetical protein
MRSASVHDRKNSLCSRCPKTLLPCGWRPSQTREFTHTSSGRPLFGALRRRSGANAAADRVAEGLAEYWQRNQGQIYPLYELIGTRRRDDTRRAG